MREKILAMKAGRTLDWMIAQDVMGINDKIFDFAYEAGNFNYSSDMSAAWEVFLKVEHDKERSKIAHLSFGQWVCCFDDTHSNECKTAPEAICKAALLAVMDL